MWKKISPKLITENEIFLMDTIQTSHIVKYSDWIIPRCILFVIVIDVKKYEEGPFSPFFLTPPPPTLPPAYVMSSLDKTVSIQSLWNG